jgi:hypothetical protein
MNLFIDSNVFLFFFHFSKDDLEELDKLAEMTKRKKVRLIVPEQVRLEVRRNRERVILQCLESLSSLTMKVRFPNLAESYDLCDNARSAMIEANKHLQKLASRIGKDASSRELQADKALARVFAYSDGVDLSDEVLERSRVRMALGHPPGKKDSLGDAINWETLLLAVPEGEDLHFVSSDGDWISPLGSDEFNGFLQSEWEDRKKSCVYFYRQLSAFLGEHFPSIKLAADVEKDALIDDLQESGSFAATRTTLRQLHQWKDFTDEQLARIARAAMTNRQVYWILDDNDIFLYLRDILGVNADRLEPAVGARIREALRMRDR